MSTLPLEQELKNALHRDLWTLRRAMAEEAESGDASSIEYIPPAHRYLPELHAACAALTEAQSKAKAEISRDLECALKREGFATVDPVYEIAKQAPEVRRYWLLSQLLLLLRTGVDILEEEGRPKPPGPTPLPKLVKSRSWAFGHGK